MCVCVCVPVVVDLHMVGLGTYCRLPMADACNVANNSSLACDHVVETRSGQESPQVGVAIPSSILCMRRHKEV